MRTALLLAAVATAAHGARGGRRVRDYQPVGARGYAGGPVTAPEDFVNTPGGTKAIGGQEDSFGNVLPEVTMPWGFNGWTPVTTLDTSGWFFHSEARNIYGVRCTHQPSPWIGDMGQFRAMAHSVDPNHEDVDVMAAYNPRLSQWSPYHFNASLLPYGHRSGFASLAVAPTMHGAVIKFTFLPYQNGAFDGGYNQTRRVMLSLDSSSGALALGAPTAGGLLTASGASVANSGGVPGGWGGHYFYATLGGGEDGTAPLTPTATGLATSGNKWLFYDFAPSNDTAVTTFTLRIATSLVSAAQAQLNHGAQVAGRTLEAVAADAKAAWHAELSRVTVGDAGAALPPADAAAYLTIFYSSLYRAAKFPRALWEYSDGAGSAASTSGTPVHWSPYTNTVLPGVFSTDQGFWDAYRTTYSLLVRF
jgi:hypothetical protein